MTSIVMCFLIALIAATAIKDLTRQIAFDCDVRKHVKVSLPSIFRDFLGGKGNFPPELGLNYELAFI